MSYESSIRYTDGFGPAVAALAEWWKDRAAGQAAVDGFLTLTGTSTIDPAMWTLDQALLEAPGRKKAAEALLKDYQHNPRLYPE